MQFNISQFDIPEAIENRYLVDGEEPEDIMCDFESIVWNLADKLHAGQTDKLGAPYTDHTTAVGLGAMDIAAKLFNEMDADVYSTEFDDGFKQYYFERAVEFVGNLHDSIEDYFCDKSRASSFAEGIEIGKRYLIGEGVPEHIVDSVALLTHDPTVPYQDYIDTLIASNNIHAIIVKIADNRHNSLPERNPVQDEKSKKRLAKYAESLPKLEAALARIAAEIDSL